MRLSRWVLSFILVKATLCIASADGTQQAVKISTPPTIDGIISDEEWKDVPFVEGLHDPDTGASYADNGRFWLAYDRNFVYFAAKLKESDLHAIRATEYRTNVSLAGDDYVELDLDLSGSLSAFNSFQINPQGATNVQIASGRAAKREWLGEFVAKSRITAEGWEAEARIPWQAMDIPKGGRRNIRFNILRFVAKLHRKYSYVYVPATQTGLTPTWAGVELPKPELDRSIKLLPYIYAGYDPATKGVFNSGVDTKTALTEQVNLVGSVNPDFRNIENQILSIDFSRFERLAGESRPFFQEGAQYSNSQIFASQRISGFDAGLNGYGRLSDKMSFSLISAARFGKESDTIANFTEDPTPNTSLRFTGTDLEQPGLSNRTYLLRLSQNMGDYNVFLRNMGSRDTLLGFGQQYDLDLGYSRAGLTFMGGWTRADAGFNPRLGFVQEVNLQGPALGFEYARTYSHGSVSDYDAQVLGLSYDHADGSFYRKEANLTASATVRPGLNLLMGADLADFEGSKDSLYSLQAQYPRGNPYKNLALHLDVGRQAGIQYRSLTAASAYRITRKLQLTLREQHVTYGAQSDQTIFSTNWDLGRDRAVSGRIVRQGNDTNAYLAFQRNGNLGVEYFLILGDPNARRYRNSLILKIAVPLTLGRKGLSVNREPSTISRSQ